MRTEDSESSENAADGALTDEGAGAQLAVGGTGGGLGGCRGGAVRLTMLLGCIVVPFMDRTRSKRFLLLVGWPAAIASAVTIGTRVSSVSCKQWSVLAWRCKSCRGAKQAPRG